MFGDQGWIFILHTKRLNGVFPLVCKPIYHGASNDARDAEDNLWHLRLGHYDYNNISQLRRSRFVIRLDGPTTSRARRAVRLVREENIHASHFTVPQSELKPLGCNSY